MPLRKTICDAHLKARVFAHPQASHPHVGEQHLAAGVGNEITLLSSHSQL